MSARADLLTSMVELWKEKSDYHVHRGPLNWASFDFDEYPKGISIMQERGNFGALFAKFDEGSFAWEIMAHTNQSVLDDNVTDHMIADAKAVIRKLYSQVNDYSDAVMLKTDSFSWSEISDAEMRVQGVVIQFDVTY